MKLRVGRSTEAWNVDGDMCTDELSERCLLVMKYRLVFSFLTGFCGNWVHLFQQRILNRTLHDFFT